MKLSHILLTVALLPLAPLLTSADTLLIDAIEQGSSSIPVPSRGTSMEQVRQRFGNPQQELASVGEPPITRWVYQGFTVYFERHLVITSVANRQK